MATKSNMTPEQDYILNSNLTKCSIVAVSFKCRRVLLTKEIKMYVYACSWSQ